MSMAFTFATLSPALASFRDQMGRELRSLPTPPVRRDLYERFSHDEA